jgi:UDP-N-acetylglucosamine 4-epimerase
MTNYEMLRAELLRGSAYDICLTGAAGFIGSHILEELLRLGQRVVGIDNFATGHQRNLDDVKRIVGSEAFARFTFAKGDICAPGFVETAARGCRVIIHQAALGSVKRSIDDPMETNRVNVEGTLRVLQAARTLGIKRVVYASSSSVYGDLNMSPKREDVLGNPLSPYAASKKFNEIYAEVFKSLYGLEPIGLRYFNVFGPRQDPHGDYAAVIPRWTGERLRGEESTIFGDGLTSRDFCFVSNVVQANLLAAFAPTDKVSGAYNVALGDETTLNELYEVIDSHAAVTKRPARYAAFRPGDVRNSRADISKAVRDLGFSPEVRVKDGLALTVEWYRNARSE